MIEWKEPNKEVVRCLQKHFHDVQQNNSPRIAGPTGPDPNVDYVFASEWEIAKAVGRDLTVLDDDEKQFGPLYHDWMGAPGSDLWQHVFIDGIEHNIFAADLEDGTPIVIADARVLEVS